MNDDSRLDCLDMNDAFEAEAHLFYQQTGMLAPGKSVPAAEATESYDQDRRAAWDKWRSNRARRPPMNNQTDPWAEQMEAEFAQIEQDLQNEGIDAVSYTHLTLPTTPYV